MLGPSPAGIGTTPPGGTAGFDSRRARPHGGEGRKMTNDRRPSDDFAPFMDEIDVYVRVNREEWRVLAEAFASEVRRRNSEYTRRLASSLPEKTTRASDGRRFVKVSGDEAFEVWITLRAFARHGKTGVYVGREDFARALDISERFRDVFERLESVWE